MRVLQLSGPVCSFITIIPGLMNVRPHILSGILLPAVALLFATCSSPVTFVRPREWATDSLQVSVIRAYARVLAGHRIFLDPGHGGDDRQNQGPGGEAIEADVNLRVALALRTDLREAGAIVLMSRDTDTTLGLRERVRMAIDQGAEVFISLHHNATAQNDNTTNYAAVYYHAHEGVSGYHPSNHDLARYIARDMSYAMRNPLAPSSSTFDGTLSDFDVYPNSGFAVLRDNPIPSALIEASFFTHPPEEKRLTLEEFNKVEAWGIFVGLGRYFAAGIPQLALRSDTVGLTARPEIRLSLGPRGSFDGSSFQLYLDGSLIRSGISLRDTTVVWNPQADLLSGPHTLSAVLRNQAGNSSWPYRRPLLVRLPAASLIVRLHPAPIPAGVALPLRITCSGSDIQHRSLADGTTIRVAVKGTPVDTMIVVRNGSALAFCGNSADTDSLRIRTQSGPVTRFAAFPRLPVRGSVVAGTVRSSIRDSSLAGASVRFQGADRREPLADTASTDGQYSLWNPADDVPVVIARLPGFFPHVDTMTGNAIDTHHAIVLEPVLDGVLTGKSFVLDPEADTSVNDAFGAALSLEVTTRLMDLLSDAGAVVTTMRSNALPVSVDERIRRALTLPRGIYLRIDCSGKATALNAEIYANPANQRLASMLLHSLHRWTRIDSGTIVPSSDRFYRNIPMTVVTLGIPAPRAGTPDGRTMIDDVAWGAFAGLAAWMGGDTTVVSLPFAPGQPEGFVGGVFRRAVEPDGTITTLKLAPSLHVYREKIP